MTMCLVCAAASTMRLLQETSPRMFFDYALLPGYYAGVNLMAVMHLWWGSAAVFGLVFSLANSLLYGAFAFGVVTGVRRLRHTH